MNAHKRLTLGLSAAAVIAAIAAGLLTSSQAFAQDPTVSMNRVSALTGSTVSVALTAEDIGAPGLGAWEIGILFDPSLVSAVGCDAQNGSICNPNFANDVVLVAGASASGQEGNTVLATVSFRCDAEGVTALALDVITLADATTGAPQDISATVADGSIACSETAPQGPTNTPRPRPRATQAEPSPTPKPVSGLPNTGAGGSGDSGSAGLLLGLAAAGLAAGALGLRMRRARRP